MRIIGEIPHPSLKISIFKTGDRISVKFENERYEQTFKLGNDERLASPESISQWADARFMQQVQQTFQQMHQSHMDAVNRLFPAETNSLFEEII
ncbi:MAG: hypothetical protein JNM22_13895 [Saprospiraceae bacterium]|nr:hypothetical protein [Saprospiraceae bacterium]